MSLRDWEKNGWLRAHTTTKQEIADLVAIADRDLTASKTVGLHDDWRLNIAYNAALQLATAALAANGYRVDRGGGNQHYRTIDALSLTLGTDANTIKKLDIFRKKRHLSDYERVGATTKKDVDEMRSIAEKLKSDLLAWFDQNHPKLKP